MIREDNTDQDAGADGDLRRGVRRARPTRRTARTSSRSWATAAAVFLKGLNDASRKLGPDYVAAVVGSAGYSRGEDKFMGPPRGRTNPTRRRGGLVAGVLARRRLEHRAEVAGRQQDREQSRREAYDPDALNWVERVGLHRRRAEVRQRILRRAQEHQDRQEGEALRQGVVTWTPGDVTIAEKKGGLVSIVSTKENRMQMPQRDHRQQEVDGGESGARQADAGGDLRGGRSDQGIRRRCAGRGAVGAGLRREGRRYWQKYFKPVVERTSRARASSSAGRRSTTSPTTLSCSASMGRRITSLPPTPRSPTS